MHKVFITGSIFNAPLHPKTAFLGKNTVLHPYQSLQRVCARADVYIICYLLVKLIVCISMYIMCVI